jgi:UDP-glucose 4-epimerase
VIPLFVNQIKAHSPVTITDPNMTRFLMSLDEAVDLVLFAFKNGNQGDLFIQKAPACTIEVLAEAVIEVMNADTEVKIIGTRHGEKLYETLCTREEMAKAEDLGDFYRIPADNRDLNYGKYFQEGETKVSHFEDYNSHNTQRLNIEETKQALLKLNYIQNVLNNQYEV